ncbi:nuclear transport factor 2 family protein [Pseudohalocynthiibacter sp. F2068]|jgi:ketosteroid isomerase-like protein|uniref:nuclear transport factor 2 family protein n=1 Tax=Pseudohalocynthiibacter sp. F2068 TaxID=2926418 RepID=UPI001FF2D878|nr:nuclear transport factor 2 family protein [Pseudohalocynthiibacter sp. F2068]MCK0100691.1 nuclear transport factor 2 family protein [Pseudohalocynthiibacter sp. F2068]
MTREAQITLVKRYFDAVDGEDLLGLLDTLAPDCVFTVETHSIRLEGHAEISAMFTRLWTDHTAVLHHTFTHVPDPESGRIATRFTVQNTEHDGSLTHKSNCNFFEIADGRFATVRVYMTGQNTLKDTA